MDNNQPNAPRLMPEPAGFRTRYRSEPGVIGHYPWAYADQCSRRPDRPECEIEDLYTSDQVRALLAAERERLAQFCDNWMHRRDITADDIRRS